MSWQSLRTRLLVAYIGLIVLGFGSVVLVAGRQLAQSVVEDFEHNLTTQAILVARSLSEVIEHDGVNGRDPAKLTQLVKDFATRLETRVIVINDAGQIWLDSANIFPTDDQRRSPEIAAAFAGHISYEIRPDEHQASRVHAAAPMGDADKILGVVQLSTPLAVTQPRIWQRWFGLGLGVLLVACAALAVGLWLAASLTRPLAHLRAMAHQIAEGNFTARVPVTRNDEISQVASAFNHMATQVEAMLDEQRAFASNASHELRTPLTTIRIRSEALRNNFSDQPTLDAATQQQYIAEIDDEARNLGNLVEDLIVLSRFDTGGVEVGQEEVDVVRLAKALLREFVSMTENHHLLLSLAASADLPPVTANLTHLRVVLRNVLDNAIKYTPDGGEITWHLWVEAEQLHSTLQDTGRGVAPTELAHLFERFYRADHARSRATPGVGLGLALAKSIVAFYGGEILVTSPGIGQGTTVHIIWPLNAYNLGNK